MRKARIWNLITWTLALGAFAIAAVLSYRKVDNNDLRSPTVLLVNALLATGVACGFAMREGSLSRWVNVHLCFGFGLWAAAIFRLIPPIDMESILYFKNLISADVPYVILFACIRGGLWFLLVSPFAVRVLDDSKWTPGESLTEMCGSAILLFFIIAAVVRLMADPAVSNW